MQRAAVNRCPLSSRKGETATRGMGHKMTQNHDPEWHRRRPIVIAADDLETIGRAAGLIAAGEAVVRLGLSRAAAKQGASLVSVALAEAEQEAAAAREEANRARTKAQAAERRLVTKTRPTGPRTAQDLVNKWATEGMPAPTWRMTARQPRRRITETERRMPTPEELENPPKTVRASDPLTVGRWAEAIRDGRTEVVDD